MTETIVTRREWGAAIAKRASAVKGGTALLKEAFGRFTRAQTAFERAAAEADDAMNARDEILATVKRRDAEVDRTVIKLSAAMVGAEMTPARSPFKGYSKYSPARLVGLKYVDEYREVGALLTKLRRVKGLKPVVIKAMADVTAKLTVVEKSLADLTDPQTRATAAITARDGLLVEWEASLHSLQLQAKAAWEKTPGKVTALFAPVARQAKGTKARASHRVAKKKGRTSKKAPASAAAATPAPDPTAPTTTKK